MMKILAAFAADAWNKLKHSGVVTLGAKNVHEIEASCMKISFAVMNMSCSD